jgi:hypothetical protein
MPGKIRRNDFESFLERLKLIRSECPVRQPAMNKHKLGFLVPQSGISDLHSIRGCSIAVHRVLLGMLALGKYHSENVRRLRSKSTSAVEVHTLPPGRFKLQTVVRESNQGI